jgi:uncharacterized protein YyaL (SSP411 family)
VSIKVDREERPDLDSIYMTAVQAMTGQGGWPLNVFITPDGVPFYGGTYWPPADRPGYPSFRKVLDAVADAYRGKRKDVLENAEQIRTYLVRANQAATQAGDLDTAVLEDAVDVLARMFDAREGGFGGAPKFPQPSVLEFLLRYCYRTRNPQAEKMVRLTLDKMAAGGMYDQIGGGFHRYSVDAIWLVPHFEKMLYDNAQLARVYLDAYRLFGDSSYRKVVVDILDYVVREMTSPEGGFYSTQDADSEGEEGKFFVWTKSEIEEVLGPEDAAIACRAYGVTEGGNFEGHSILFNAAPDEDFELDAIRAKLFAAREKRAHPGRDEKIITSWNGMMLRAFAEASRVLQRDDYRRIAIANGEFLASKLRNRRGLFHTYKDGVAKINGFLDDYAQAIDGLAALYEATFDRKWIDSAISLTWVMIDEFADQDGIGFFDTGAGHERLVARPRDVHDGATPSGNSVAASVLLKLAAMTEVERLRERAAEILKSMAEPMAKQPIGFGRYLSATEAYLGTAREIAIAAPAGDAAVEGYATAVYERFEPYAVVGLADPEDESIATALPFLAHRPMKGGLPTAYLCEHFVCMPPVTDRVALIELLAKDDGISWQEI